MASFDSVNYLLRPNKNVERKLFLEMFGRLGGDIDFDGYGYVGMGSLWFVDFNLIHKRLGISDLVSIEREAPDRAEFNRPFGCVRVEPGDSTKVLPELKLGHKPHIIWMDYDSNLSGPVLDDIRHLTSDAAVGSILIVSVNAHVCQVRRQKDPDDRPMDELEALRFTAGDLVPADLTDIDFSRATFPGVVSRILVNAFRHGVRAAARTHDFQLLVNVTYGDNAPMVSVGGILQDPETPTDLERLSTLPFWPPDERPFEIDLPILTMREKAALDRHMPGSRPPTVQEIQDEYHFELDQSKLDSYHRFYRHYPLFGEYEF